MKKKKQLPPPKGARDGTEADQEGNREKSQWPEKKGACMFKAPKFT